jgi:ribokinase
MDLIVHVPRIPALGETLLGDGSLKLVPGGKGANQAVAMARLGACVAMAGRVGTDPFSEPLLQSLHDAHIETDLIAVDQEENSGVASIFLTRQGDNAIVVSSGANLQLGKDQLQFAQILQALQRAQALVLQLEIPVAVVCRLIEEAYTISLPVVLNLAPALPLSRDVLKKVSVLILNESEASLLSGQHVENMTDASAVATSLHSDGIPTVVITLGSRGALLITTDENGQPQSFYQDVPKVAVIDTTAAGDCFVGALTVALIEGQSPEEALRFAVTASSLKVTKFGAQSGLPTREEVLSAIPYTPI